MEKVLLVHDLDPFAILEIKPCFDLDFFDCQKVYQEKLSRIHPDHHLGTSGWIQDLLMQQATMLNWAYQTLQDPLKRTAFLLKKASIDCEKPMSPMILQSLLDMYARYDEQQTTDRKEKVRIEIREQFDREVEGLKESFQKMNWDKILYTYHLLMGIRKFFSQIGHMS